MGNWAIMKTIHVRTSSSPCALGRQRGVLTVFSGVLILVMLTLMMFFGMRVGMFDQRVAADNIHQKQAFHVAESGIHHAKEYLRANNVLITSTKPNLLDDGRDGWLATGFERWQKCATADFDNPQHPCAAEPNEDFRPPATETIYYYSSGGSMELPPVGVEGLIPGDEEVVSVNALLCVFDIDYDDEDGDGKPVEGCLDPLDPSLPEDTSTRNFAITLLAKAGADCTGGDPATCNAKALLREQVSDFGAVAGGNSPAVPLTTRTSFPPSGSAEVVANPNAGGVGVPLSVWMNANESCSSGTIASPETGSWATCEYHEWYEVDAIPDGVRCPSSSCSCANSETISNTHGSDVVLGIDLDFDPEFPCDLFQFFFGVAKTDYELIKGLANVISDCSVLDENSFGIYWVTGSECNIQSNVEVGNADTPLLLISAASTTILQGGATIFGIMFLSDAEDAGATLDVRGNNIVYGSVVVDVELGSYNGTFQIIYNENIVKLAGGQGGIGNIIGAWSDFHPTWNPDLN